MGVSPEQLKTQVEILSLLANLVLGFVLVVLAVVSARAARREWRYQHITKEWAELIEFLTNHTEYMDGERNKNYRTEYTGEEMVKYELVARLCIGYLDDVYHLKMWDYQGDWLTGSVRLLAGRHEAWLKDNPDSYSKEFHAELLRCLALGKQGGPRPDSHGGREDGESRDHLPRPHRL